MKFNDYMQKKESAQPLNENKTIALNEAEEGGLMAFFKDMKSYAVLMSEYPALYKEKKEAEVDKAVTLAKFDAMSGEKKLDMEEKAEEAMKAKLESLPREKRAAFRAQMEEKLKLQKQKITDTIAAKKKGLENQLEQKVKDIQSDIDDLNKENPLNSDYMSKSVENMKIETQLDMDEKYELEKIEKVFAVSDKSEEQMEKIRKRSKERLAKENAEKEAKAVKLEQEAKEAEEALQAKIEKQGPENKETLETLKSVQSDIRNFLTLGKELVAMKNESFKIETIIQSFDTIFEAEGDDKIKAKKKEFTELRKAISAKIDKLSAAKIGKALGGTTEDGEEILGGLKDQWEEVKQQYKKERDDAEEVNLNDVDNDDDNTQQDPPAPPAEKEKTSKLSDEDRRDLEKKLTGAQTALKKAQDEGKDEKVIAQIQANITNLEGKLKESAEATYEELSEGIDVILSEINSLYEDSAPAVPAASAEPVKTVLTFNDFVARNSK
jgi:hypothetical protein